MYAERKSFVSDIVLSCSHLTDIIMQSFIVNIMQCSTSVLINRHGHKTGIKDTQLIHIKTSPKNYAISVSCEHYELYYFVRTSEVSVIH